VPFRAYAEEWVERYHGHGRRGFRESTRADYRADLERYAFPYFDERFGRTVSAITPRDVANFVGWLCNEQERPLADATVRRILAPVRSCLATAVREGLVRHNPAAGASLPHRPTVEDDDGDQVRVLTRAQLATFLELVHPRYRVMFRLLAATGLRWSELIALQWKHLRLDGSEPCVRVRRALPSGAKEAQPPKSKHGRRDIPIDPTLASDLRRRRAMSEWPRDEDLVFPSEAGTPLNHSNMMRRVVRPVAEEVGAPWAGFHTFRHTCASMLFERGANAVRVQRWLGHHSPAFTLSTYVHLLDDRLGEPIELAAELAASAQTSRHSLEPGSTTEAPGTSLHKTSLAGRDAADLSEVFGEAAEPPAEFG
jgi:integrase